MAIQLLKENDRFNTYHQHFLIDGSDDLTSLEANYKCQMGDCAELPDGTVYVRHSDDYQGDKWVIKNPGGDGDSSSNILAVTIDPETETFNKTWQEVNDAEGVIVNFINGEEKKQITSEITIEIDNDMYVVGCNGVAYFTDSPNEYPSTRGREVGQYKKDKFDKPTLIDPPLTEGKTYTCVYEFATENMARQDTWYSKDDNFLAETTPVLVIDDDYGGQISISTTQIEFSDPNHRWDEYRVTIYTTYIPK